MMMFRMDEASEAAGVEEADPRDGVLAELSMRCIVETISRAKMLSTVEPRDYVDWSLV